MGLTFECIDHVTLPVTYLKRSVAFYRDVLGLAPLHRPEYMPLKDAWFAVTERQQVHLVYNDGWRGDGTTAQTHYHFALRVDDLAAARAQLLATGWPVSDVEQRPDGTKRLFVKDPDGHVIELCQPSN